ncbi:MAG: hypothetical protein WC076_00205 [Terrimicrobiaceae bacterium]|jgi:hypothetical protein
MNSALFVTFFIAGLAFALSMLVAAMIKLVYYTVRFFTAIKEPKS